MFGYTNAGGGAVSDAWAYIGVAYPAGSSCSATNGTITLNAQGTSGLYVFNIPQPSSTPETWTVSCTDGTRTKSATVSIDTQYQNAVVTLTYSRLPEGYQEVEYLEQSSGYEYVIFPNITSTDTQGSFEFAWQPKSYSRSNFYSVMGYISGNSGVASWTTGSSGSYSIGYKYNSGSAVSSVVTGVKRSIIINEITTRSIKENGATLGTCSGYLPTGIAIYYGAVSYDATIYYNTSQMQLFEFKRTNNEGTLILDAVPCKRTSDNVCGFYDLIGGTFYVNANNSGSFIAGADV